MRYLRKWQLAFVCLLALAFFPFMPARRGTAQAPGYTVTDLGTLGGDTSRAYGLDECGRVVGEAQATAGEAAPFRPFRWDNGAMIDLGTLGGPSGTAYAINQADTTAGSAMNASGNSRAFVRPPGGPPQDIGDLGGSTVEAYDINASGQVVGISEASGGGSLEDRAFVWQSGTGMQALTATWGTPLRAIAINDAGQIAGTATHNTSGTHAFLTIGGDAKDLGTLGGSVSFAHAVNDVGEAVGYSYISTNALPESFHAFYWKDTNSNGQHDPGEMRDLGTLGGRESYAYDLNDSGVVVGRSNVTPGSGAARAFIWRDANSNGQSDPGEMQDLNSVVSGTGWTFQEAQAINDRGQIAGFGLNPQGKVHAFLLTPTNVGPSPCDTTPTPTPTPGTLQFSDPAIYSVGEGNSTAVITVTRTGGDDGAVQVSYATSNGTAVATTSSHLGDYDATGGVLDFADGETTKTFSVTISDDAHDEPDETINLTLSNPTGGATLGPRNTAVLTIIDNDAAPSLSIADVSVPEGNTGSSPATTAAFGVTLTGVSAQTVTIDYATSDGTATQPGDYAPASGTVTFNPGETGTRYVNVSVVGDTLDESNETFNVTLSNATNATVSDNTATGTINDDDGTPALSIDDVTVTEGNTGTTAATFTVSLLPASGQAVTVKYATADGTANAGPDYGGTAGTLTFAPGETTKTVTVQAFGDPTPEAHETFFVNLSEATNVTIADTQGQATVNNDDTSLSINDVGALEAAASASGLTFTVSLSHPTVNKVTVKYATSDGTATAGSDYTATSGTLEIPADSPSGPITVQVSDDAASEVNETFNVTLSDATNASISDNTGVGTINNDDNTPSLSISDAEVAEGNSGTTNVTFTVTLSAASGQTVTVNYATADGTATSGSDYTATSGTLTFAPGDTSETFTVVVAGDALDEINETFNVTLSSPMNATVSDGTGVGTITDDDATPFLSINDAAVNEGNSGTAAATFTVTLSAPSGQAVTVKYVSADGTANAGPDYGGTAGTLTFAPGETTKTVTVQAFGDTFNEPNETFFVNLSEATNATIADGQGQGTINNDDASTFRFSQDAYLVGESAHFVTVSVERTGDLSSAARVDFATSDGTASERRDYTAVSGRLQFAAGEASKNFDVLLTVDAYAEVTETINLTLSNPTGGAALGGQSTATVNIQDTPPPGPNPIDIASDFVRQHYHDFLGREPDASGLAHWTGQMTNCGNPNLEICRINVSAAFFQAIEFQQTGYLVYRTYKAAYGDTTSPGVPGTVPVIRLNEFLPDTRIIGDGVIVGPAGWELRLDANKNAYMQEFVQRDRFLTAYPLTLTAAEFVDRLNTNAGGVLTQDERNALAGDLSNGAKTRAQVLRAVAENAQLQQNEFRRAFVLMQYYGYLRRNPDDAPEQNLNFGGWKFWLDKLNDFNGNFVQAQMVKAFLDSIEYRTRFAP